MVDQSQRELEKGTVESKNRTSRCQSVQLLHLRILAQTKSVQAFVGEGLVVGSYRFPSQPIDSVRFPLAKNIVQSLRSTQNQTQMMQSCAAFSRILRCSPHLGQALVASTYQLQIGFGFAMTAKRHHSLLLIEIGPYYRKPALQVTAYRQGKVPLFDLTWCRCSCIHHPLYLSVSDAEARCKDIPTPANLLDLTTLRTTSSRKVWEWKRRLF